MQTYEGMVGFVVGSMLTTMAVVSLIGLCSEDAVWASKILWPQVLTACCLGSIAEVLPVQNNHDNVNVPIAAYIAVRAFEALSHSSVNLFSK